MTHRLQTYLLKITTGRWSPFTSMHCCKRVWKLPYTRLHLHCSWSSVLHSEHTTSFFKFLHPSQYGILRWYATMSTNTELLSKDMLHFCHRLRFVITTNTGNTLLQIPMLHCDWPYEMASSPLLFPFPPTTKSYHASTIFKFSMCQSAPCHPVYLYAECKSLKYYLCCFTSI